MKSHDSSLHMMYKFLNLKRFNCKHCCNWLVIVFCNFTWAIFYSSWLFLYLLSLRLATFSKVQSKHTPHVSNQQFFFYGCKFIDFKKKEKINRFLFLFWKWLVNGLADFALKIWVNLEVLFVTWQGLKFCPLKNNVFIVFIMCTFIKGKNDLTKWELLFCWDFF